MLFRSIFAPMIKKWAEYVNVPSKKFLIPLSYATILGGMCTVIGTTTNLVVDGMMISETGKGMPIFEIGKVGLPIAIVGLLYIIFASRYLLPKDDDIKPEDKTGIKEYYYDVTIPENSKFIGTSIVNGQTDIIPNIEIKNIKSENKIINSYDSDHIIKINDKLEIAGRSSLLNALMGNKDIRLNCLQNRDHNFKEKATIQVEAVLAPRFPGIGKTLEEFDFYRHYGAAIMSIHRNGTRINENLEEVRLQVGDNLLLLTDDSFIPAWGESSVFYLLSQTGEIRKTESPKRRLFALLLVAIMILGAALGDKVELRNFKIDMFSMAALTTVIMAWTNLFPVKKYTKFISWDVMITIACAFAISKGMMNSGIAAFIAKNTIGAVYDFGPHVVLAVLFVITCIFTEIITNNAAAALAFPIALEASRQLGVDPLPFFVTICMAASASFLTPIGYQTNLIVHAIGNYKFSDYLKVGLPMTIIVFIMSVILIPIIWPF